MIVYSLIIREPKHEGLIIDKSINKEICIFKNLYIYSYGTNISTWPLPGTKMLSSKSEASILPREAVRVLQRP
jgi:hypothetical protein